MLPPSGLPSVAFTGSLSVDRLLKAGHHPKEQLRCVDFGREDNEEQGYGAAAPFRFSSRSLADSVRRSHGATGRFEAVHASTSASIPNFYLSR